MQAKLIHARFHPGRHVACPGGIGRNRQPPHRRFHLAFPVGVTGFDVAAAFARRLGLFGFRLIQANAAGFFD